MKVIVAHPGRQHSFRVAKALKESGLLYKYATTVYNKDSSLLMKLVKLFINSENKKRASNRRCESLSDDDVVLFESFLGYILLLVQRIDKKRLIFNKFNDYISLRFQRKLAQFAMTHGVDAIISFDANCAECFRILKEKGSKIQCVMDNAAPNRDYLYHVYNEHMAECGPFTITFRPYRYLWDKKEAERFAKEVLMADYHIVASSFSKNALLYENVPTNRIFVIPYGVDADRYKVQNRKFTKGRLNLLYVGQINQRKGIYQILEAAKQINNPSIHFNIVGAGFEEMPSVYAPYMKYVTFHGSAYFNQLLNHYANNDVFLFPSMGDGFGLVVLEAMAAGLPVIASTNSAGPDIIDEGKNGFVIPICDTPALVEKILWFWNNQDTISQMSIDAIRSVRKYSWNNYEEGIVNAVLRIAGE